MQKQRKFQDFHPEDAPITLENEPFYDLDLDEDQQNFRDMIWDPSKLIVVCDSKAGTGKTTVALGVANMLYQYGFYNGISYIVSPSMEEKQGYLPGDQESKTAPYMQPLIDACLSLNINPTTAIKSENNYQAIKDGKAYIDFMAHTFLRGTNFENQIVIIDEAQNFYFDELKKVLTRIHDNCKTIIIGHTKQCDLYKHANRSGFLPYLRAFEEIDNVEERCAVCRLTHNHRGWVSTFCDNVEFEDYK
jgi:predicted ribonuclease YlaK